MQFKQRRGHSNAYDDDISDGLSCWDGDSEISLHLRFHMYSVSAFTIILIYSTNNVDPRRHTTKQIDEDRIDNEVQYKIPKLAGINLSAFWSSDGLVLQIVLVEGYTSTHTHNT
jgi:hypothetical protein